MNLCNSYSPVVVKPLFVATSLYILKIVSVESFLPLPPPFEEVTSLICIFIYRINKTDTEMVWLKQNIYQNVIVDETVLSFTGTSCHLAIIRSLLLVHMTM